MPEKSVTVKCPECNGTGENDEVIKYHKQVGDWAERVKLGIPQCKVCNGTGEIALLR